MWMNSSAAVAPLATPPHWHFRRSLPQRRLSLPLGILSAALGVPLEAANLQTMSGADFVVFAEWVRREADADAKTDDERNGTDAEKDSHRSNPTKRPFILDRAIQF